MDKYTCHEELNTGQLHVTPVAEPFGQSGDCVTCLCLTEQRKTCYVVEEYVDVEMYVCQRVVKEEQQQEIIRTRNR